MTFLSLADCSEHAQDEQGIVVSRLAFICSKQWKSCRDMLPGGQPADQPNPMCAALSAMTTVLWQCVKVASCEVRISWN